MVSITETDLGDGFIEVTLVEPFHLVLNTDNGFFNATQLCGLENKLLSRYTELLRTKHLRLALKLYSKLLSFETSGNENIAGTYFHPTLMLDLALWISPQVYARTAAIIMAETVHKEERRRLKAAELFDCEEIVGYVYVGPRNLRLQCLDPKLVNGRGYFNYTSFLYAAEKKLINFEKDEKYVPLVKYLQNRGLFDQDYHHPLLFLYLAAWVRLDLFVPWARAIFGCRDKRLHSLIRDAIEAAATGIRSCKSEPVIKSDQSPIESAKSPKFNRQSTSSALMAIIGQPDFMNICHMQSNLCSTYRGSTVPISDSDEDSDSTMTDAENSDSERNTTEEDSDSTMDTADEVDRRLYDVKLAQLKHEMGKTIERKRAAKHKALAEKDEALKEKHVALIEKTAALMREQEKDKELERLKKEKQEIDGQYEKLLKQFQKLHVDYKSLLRRKPHRRTSGSSKSNIVEDPMGVKDVAKQECLVLSKLTTGEMYAIGGQLSTLKAILKQLPNIAKFVGWYVCDDAVKVFNHCKDIVEIHANVRGHTLHTRRSNVIFVECNPDVEEFDLTAVFCETLRDNFAVFEADASILDKLFGQNVQRSEYDLPSNPTKARLVKKVHKFIED